MTKTFADICLERAEKATEGPWVNRPRGVVQSQSVEKIIFWDDEPNQGDKCEDIKPNYEFIASARSDVPELARRLNRSIVFIKIITQEIVRNLGCDQETLEEVKNLIKELEAPLKDIK